MARVNIEDSIYSDIRFSNLILKKGSLDSALGHLVRAWTLAQRHWTKPHQLIPQLDWTSSQLGGDLIDVGLAEVRGDMVYMKGSEEQFRWLDQARAAGKKSANVRQRETNGRWSDSQPPSTSSSSSSSSSSSLSFSDSSSGEQLKPSDGGPPPAARKRKPKPDSATQEVRRSTWEAYRQAYFDRWKKEPVRNATVNGQIANLVTRLGEDSPGVIEFFVNHNDSYYIRNCHPVGLCVKNAEGLHTQWANGRQITSAGIRQFEKSQHVREQLERLERGEL